MDRRRLYYISFGIVSSVFLLQSFYCRFILNMVIQDWLMVGLVNLRRMQI